MHVVITTFGSTGDLIPFVALGLALQKRGHQVTCAIPVHMSKIIEKYDLPYVPIGPDLGDVSRQMQRHITEGTFTKAHAEERTRLLQKIAPKAIQVLRGLCAKADVLVALDRMPFVNVVQRLTKIPTVLVCVSYPEYEQQVEDAQSLHHAKTQFSNQLNLYALSAKLYQPSQPLPSGHHVTGFFFIDQHNNTLGEELETFLQAGPPPIVMSLGSMVHTNPDELLHDFAEAIKRVGCRAIIQKGWSGIGKNHTISSPNIYLTGFLPYPSLLPRSAGVVHHGGAGTTASTLRAGVPAIIIPHAMDQFVIADKANALGCVSDVISYPDLTVDRLTNALQRIQDDLSLTEQAKMVAKGILAEDGVQTASLLIEDLIMGQDSTAPSTLVAK